MQLIWTAHLVNNPEKKKQFEDRLRNSSDIIDRMIEILEEKENYLDKIEHSLSSYESPGWSHKQAHINGKRAQLEEMKQLLQI